MIVPSKMKKKMYIIIFGVCGFFAPSLDGDENGCTIMHPKKRVATRNLRYTNRNK